MERFYDGDQDKLFAEARVINPFRKGPLISRSRSSQSSLVSTFYLSQLSFLLLSLRDHYTNYIIHILQYLIVQKNIDQWHRRMWNLFYDFTILSKFVLYNIFYEMYQK